MSLACNGFWQYVARFCRQCRQIPSRLRLNANQLNPIFSSEEALNRWLERYPELKDRKRASVAEAFEEIQKRERK